GQRREGLGDVLLDGRTVQVAGHNLAVRADQQNKRQADVVVLNDFASGILRLRVAEEPVRPPEAVLGDVCLRVLGRLVPAYSEHGKTLVLAKRFVLPRPFHQAEAKKSFTLLQTDELRNVRGRQPQRTVGGENSEVDRGSSHCTLHAVYR